MKRINKCLWCGLSALMRIAKRKDGVYILKCKDCGLFMVEKIPNDLKKYYNKEAYFNPLDGQLDIGYPENYDLMSPFYLYWQSSIIDLLIEKDNYKLLEVGCATGNLLEVLKKRFSNFKIKGIDISQYVVDECKKKRLDVECTVIENLQSGGKFDIIFSSETMEHVEDLSKFLRGVRANLAKSGVFVFYIPSVRRKEIQAQKSNYKPFNTSLEHILYFTPEFLTEQLSNFFHKKVFVCDFSHEDDSYIIGIVSGEQKNVARLINVLESIKNNEISNIGKDLDLIDAAFIASKFYKNDLAEKIFKKLKGRINKNELLFLEAVIIYQNGQIYKAKELFVKSIEGQDINIFNLRILYAIERDLLKYNEAEFLKAATKNKELELEINDSRHKITDFEKRLAYLYGSKIIRATIKIKNLLKNCKKKYEQFNLRRREESK